MSKLLSQVADNAMFLLAFVGVIFLMFIIAYGVEKFVKAKNANTERVLSTRKIVVTGMFAAIATILMLFEFTVPFAPTIVITIVPTKHEMIAETLDFLIW